MKYRLLQARLPSDPVRAEERGSFAAKLGVSPEDVLPYDLTAGARLAEIVGGADAILVGGSGEFGVTNDTPWMPAFFDVLGELAERGVPTFASCFGFQGLIVALGGDVQPHPPGSEVGTYDLELTDEAASDPLFQSMPAQFTAQEGHKDCALTLPPGLVHLARSERCLYQAVRVADKPVWATQFHPELSGEENSKRFARYFDLYKSVFGEEVARQKLESMRPSVHSNQLLARFHAYLTT